MVVVVRFLPLYCVSEVLKTLGRMRSFSDSDRALGKSSNDLISTVYMCTCTDRISNYAVLVTCQNRVYKTCP